MLKHYVEFLYPGFFCSGISVEEIDERDAKKVKVPDNCYAFRFFDMTVTVVDGEILRGDRKNESGYYYYQAEKMTLEQVKTTFGNDWNYRNLISYMETYGYKEAIKTRFGYVKELNDNDIVL